MADTMPLLVISRNCDHKRREWIETNYQRLGVPFEFHDAVNGHNSRKLQPYVDLIADRFWNEPTVKPGALGTFFSHYTAWQRAVDNDVAILVTEDDSLPIDTDIVARAKDAIGLAQSADLIFVNNRMSSWIVDRASPTFVGVDELVRSLRQSGQVSPFRAPGGDGYILTPCGAQKLIELTKKFGTICGVDWFMIAMASEISDADNTELGIIAQQIGNQIPALSASVLRDPLIDNSGSFPSALRHKKSIGISDLLNSIAEN